MAKSKKGLRWYVTLLLAINGVVITILALVSGAALVRDQMLMELVIEVVRDHDERLDRLDAQHGNLTKDKHPNHGS